ncbi:hypothetical protein E2C01_057816 [Portunus trituberculatus]|uniref:Uncharacterized protein n=1 Tax=Portunus trituberculatus TaxID=210409 RepID=A0A5B7H4F1_PORTR|nr:hypothetical protein [Portunus trituberculatus]
MSVGTPPARPVMLDETGWRVFPPVTDSLAGCKPVHKHHQTNTGRLSNAAAERNESCKHSSIHYCHLLAARLSGMREAATHLPKEGDDAALRHLFVI